MDDISTENVTDLIAESVPDIATEVLTESLTDIKDDSKQENPTTDDSPGDTGSEAKKTKTYKNRKHGTDTKTRISSLLVTTPSDSPLSRYGRHRKPKINEDYCNIDDVFKSKNVPAASARTIKKKLDATPVQSNETVDLNQHAPDSEITKITTDATDVTRVLKLVSSQSPTPFTSDTQSSHLLKRIKTYANRRKRTKSFDEADLLNYPEELEEAFASENEDGTTSFNEDVVTKSRAKASRKSTNVKRSPKKTNPETITSPNETLAPDLQVIADKTVKIWKRGGRRRTNVKKSPKKTQSETTTGSFETNLQIVEDKTVKIRSGASPRKKSTQTSPRRRRSPKKTVETKPEEDPKGSKVFIHITGDAPVMETSVRSVETIDETVLDESIVKKQQAVRKRSKSISKIRTENLDSSPKKRGHRRTLSAPAPPKLTSPTTSRRKRSPIKTIPNPPPNPDVTTIETTENTQETSPIETGITETLPKTPARKRTPRKPFGQKSAQRRSVFRVRHSRNRVSYTSPPKEDVKSSSNENVVEFLKSPENRNIIENIFKKEDVVHTDIIRGKNNSAAESPGKCKIIVLKTEIIKEADKMSDVAQIDDVVTQEDSEVERIIKDDEGMFFPPSVPNYDSEGSDSSIESPMYEKHVAVESPIFIKESKRSLAQKIVDFNLDPAKINLSSFGQKEFVNSPITEKELTTEIEKIMLERGQKTGEDEGRNDAEDDRKMIDMETQYEIEEKVEVSSTTIKDLEEKREKSSSPGEFDHLPLYIPVKKTQKIEETIPVNEGNIVLTLPEDKKMVKHGIVVDKIEEKSDNDNEMNIVDKSENIESTDVLTVSKTVATSFNLTKDDTPPSTTNKYKRRTLPAFDTKPEPTPGFLSIAPKTEIIPKKYPPKYEVKLGFIFWSRVGRYPFWPAIIDNEPGTNVFHKTKLIKFTECHIYHVIFFGDGGKRSWITESHMFPFKNRNDLSEKAKTTKRTSSLLSDPTHPSAFAITPYHREKWNNAVNEAESIQQLKIDQRLDAFINLLDETVTVETEMKKEPDENESTIENAELKQDSFIEKPKKRKRTSDIGSDFSNVDKKHKIDEGTIKKRGRPPRKSLVTDEVDSSVDNMPILERIQKDFPEEAKEKSLEVEIVKSEESDLKVEGFPKRVSLFRGVHKIRVCQICSKPEKVYRCKGLCGGTFHVACERKLNGAKLTRPAVSPQDFEESSNLTTDSDSSSSRRSNIIELETNEVSITKNDVNYNAPPTRKSSISCPLTIAEQIDLKMQEIMKGLIDNTKYADSSTESDGEISEKNREDVSMKDVTKSEGTKIRLGQFKCLNCQMGVIPNCFVCGSSSKNGVETRVKCSTTQCFRYYHRECLKDWPQTRWLLKGSNSDQEMLTCPLHVCHTCVSDDPRAPSSRMSYEKLARCLRCPTAYHISQYCVPAGSEILSSQQIICLKHYEKKPGGKQSGLTHINVSWCFICSIGGSLICCETCPASFHAECLKIQLPEGGYVCEDCESGRLPLYNEIVWVKLGVYRWWPAQILYPTEIPLNVMNIKHNSFEFVVKFFGSHDHYWVNRGRVFLFQEDDTGRISKKKNAVDAVFLQAMNEATQAHKLVQRERATQTAEWRIGMKPPPYIHIKTNRPVGNVRIIDANTSNTTPCDCDPRSKNPCGPNSDCLNRILMTECNPTVCAAGENCCNQQFEKRQYAPLTPFRTNTCGWGLKSLSYLPKGSFVIEYVGEVIDEREYQKRIKRKHELKDENYYFLTIDKDRMIDAGPKGNVARFMNHSCSPNCETQKWTVNGDTRVGLFAIYDIPSETELTFNYNLECIDEEKKICRCGAEKCSGFIGDKVKQNEKRKSKNNKKSIVTKIPTLDIIQCFKCSEMDAEQMCFNKICLKYYHLKCVDLNEIQDKNWFCPRHNCNVCGKRTQRYCYLCTNSYCPLHSNGNIRYDETKFVCKKHDKLKKSKRYKKSSTSDERVPETDIMPQKSLQTEIEINSGVVINVNVKKRGRPRKSDTKPKETLPTSEQSQITIVGDDIVQSNDSNDIEPLLKKQKTTKKRLSLKLKSSETDNIAIVEPVRFSQVQNMDKITSSDSDDTNIKFVKPDIKSLKQSDDENSDTTTELLGFDGVKTTEKDSNIEIVQSRIARNKPKKESPHKTSKIKFAVKTRGRKIKQKTKPKPKRTNVDDYKTVKKDTQYIIDDLNEIMGKTNQNVSSDASKEKSSYVLDSASDVSENADVSSLDEDVYVPKQNMKKRRSRSRKSWKTKTDETPEDSPAEFVRLTRGRHKQEHENLTTNNGSVQHRTKSMSPDLDAVVKATISNTTQLESVNVLSEEPYEGTTKEEQDIAVEKKEIVTESIGIIPESIENVPTENASEDAKPLEELKKKRGRRSKSEITKKTEEIGSDSTTITSELIENVTTDVPVIENASEDIKPVTEQKKKRGRRSKSEYIKKTEDIVSDSTKITSELIDNVTTVVTVTENASEEVKPVEELKKKRGRRPKSEITKETETKTEETALNPTNVAPELIENVTTVVIHPIEKGNSSEDVLSSEMSKKKRGRRPKSEFTKVTESEMTETVSESTQIANELIENVSSVFTETKSTSEYVKTPETLKKKRGRRYKSEITKNTISETNVIATGSLVMRSDLIENEPAEITDTEDVKSPEDPKKTRKRSNLTEIVSETNEIASESTEHVTELAENLSIQVTDTLDTYLPKNLEIIDVIKETESETTTIASEPNETASKLVEDVSYDVRCSETISQDVKPSEDSTNIITQSDITTSIEREMEEIHESTENVITPIETTSEGVKSPEELQKKPESQPESEITLETKEIFSESKEIVPETRGNVSTGFIEIESSSEAARSSNDLRKQLETEEITSKSTEIVSESIENVLSNVTGVEKSTSDDITASEIPAPEIAKETVLETIENVTQKEIEPEMDVTASESIENVTELIKTVPVYNVETEITAQDQKQSQKLQKTPEKSTISEIEKETTEIVSELTEIASESIEHTIEYLKSTEEGISTEIVSETKEIPSGLHQNVVAVTETTSECLQPTVELKKRRGRRPKRRTRTKTEILKEIVTETKEIPRESEVIGFELTQIVSTNIPETENTSECIKPTVELKKRRGRQTKAKVLKQIVTKTEEIASTLIENVPDVTETDITSVDVKPIEKLIKKRTRRTKIDISPDFVPESRQIGQEFEEIPSELTRHASTDLIETADTSEYIKPTEELKKKRRTRTKAEIVTETKEIITESLQNVSTDVTETEDTSEYIKPIEVLKKKRRRRTKAEIMKEIPQEIGPELFQNISTDDTETEDTSVDVKPIQELKKRRRRRQKSEIPKEIISETVEMPQYESTDVTETEDTSEDVKPIEKLKKKRKRKTKLEYLEELLLEAKQITSELNENVSSDGAETKDTSLDAQSTEKLKKRRRRRTKTESEMNQSSEIPSELIQYLPTDVIVPKNVSEDVKPEGKKKKRRRRTKAEILNELISETIEAVLESSQNASTDVTETEDTSEDVKPTEKSKKGQRKRRKVGISKEIVSETQQIASESTENVLIDVVVVENAPGDVKPSKEVKKKRRRRTKSEITKEALGTAIENMEDGGILKKQHRRQLKTAIELETEKIVKYFQSEAGPSRRTPRKTVQFEVPEKGWPMEETDKERRKSPRNVMNREEIASHLEHISLMSQLLMHDREEEMKIYESMPGTSSDSPGIPESYGIGDESYSLHLLAEITSAVDHRKVGGSVEESVEQKTAETEVKAPETSRTTRATASNLEYEILTDRKLIEFVNLTGCQVELQDILAKSNLPEAQKRKLNSMVTCKPPVTEVKTKEDPFNVSLINQPDLRILVEDIKSPEYTKRKRRTTKNEETMTESTSINTKTEKSPENTLKKQKSESTETENKKTDDISEERNEAKVLRSPRRRKGQKIVLKPEETTTEIQETPLDTITKDANPPNTPKSPKKRRRTNFEMLQESLAILENTEKLVEAVKEEKRTLKSPDTSKPSLKSPRHTKTKEQPGTSTEIEEPYEIDQLTLQIIEEILDNTEKQEENETTDIKSVGKSTKTRRTRSSVPECEKTITENEKNTSEIEISSVKTLRKRKTKTDEKDVNPQETTVENESIEPESQEIIAETVVKSVDNDNNKSTLKTRGKTTKQDDTRSKTDQTASKHDETIKRDETISKEDEKLTETSSKYEENSSKQCETLKPDKTICETLKYRKTTAKHDETTSKCGITSSKLETDSIEGQTDIKCDDTDLKRDNIGESSIEDKRNQEEHIESLTAVQKDDKLQLTIQSKDQETSESSKTVTVTESIKKQQENVTDSPKRKRNPVKKPQSNVSNPEKPSKKKRNVKRLKQQCGETSDAKNIPLFLSDKATDSNSNDLKKRLVKTKAELKLLVAQTSTGSKSETERGKSKQKTTRKRKLPAPATITSSNESESPQKTQVEVKKTKQEEETK